MKYLIFILMFMAFFSCKKKTMIKVHVENVATGEPYVDQLVYIRENPQNVQEENTTVYEGYTDSEGRLMIDFKYKRNSKYFIFISLPENYCYIHSLSYLINKEKTNDIHFRLAPCAQLKLKIENVNCEGAGDIFDMDMKPIYDENYTAFSVPTKEGCYSNEFDQTEVPSGEWFVEWWVTRGGNTEYFTDNIVLVENELKEYEILY